MGRGEKATELTRAIRSSASIPRDVLAALPSDTANAWKELAGLLPGSLYLGGGTAVVVHLRHRQSRDLDFFFHGDVDLPVLARTLEKTGRFATTHASPGTLRGLFGATKVEFLNADEVRPQKQLEAGQMVGGLRVAGLSDLLAMKLKVIGDRGELRDYFDVKTIEEQGGISVEDGIAYFLERYGMGAQSDTLQHIVRALGYLDDIDEDDALPVSKDELAGWWRARQVRLIQHLARNRR